MQRRPFFLTLPVVPAVFLSMMQTPALSQSPVPGGGSYSGGSNSAPVPGAHMQTAGAVGGAGQTTGKSRYQQLPLSPADAKAQLDELKVLLLTGNPKDVQDKIFGMCEWLSDGADAHYRMYQAFSKSELTKTQAAAEKQLNQKFSNLKREAQLLKAELLIKQNRAPEALAPLVEIVIANPSSTTGQTAYKRLCDLGFSQEAPESGVEQISGAPQTKAAK